MKMKFKNSMRDFGKTLFNVFIKYNFGFFFVVFAYLNADYNSYAQAQYGVQAIVHGLVFYLASGFFTVLFTYIFKLFR